MKKYIENYKSALSIGDFLSLNYLGIHLAHTLTDLSFAVVEEDRFQYIDLVSIYSRNCSIDLTIYTVKTIVLISLCMQQAIVLMCTYAVKLFSY